MLPLCVSSGSKLCLCSAPLLLPLLEKCAQKSKILIIFHLLFSIADGPGEAKGCQSFGAQVSSILSCDTVYDRLRVLSPSRLRPLLPVLRLCPPPHTPPFEDVLSAAGGEETTRFRKTGDQWNSLSELQWWDTSQFTHQRINTSSKTVKRKYCSFYSLITSVGLCSYRSVRPPRDRHIET